MTMARNSTILLTATTAIIIIAIGGVLLLKQKNQTIGNTSLEAKKCTVVLHNGELLPVTVGTIEPPYQLQQHPVPYSFNREDHLETLDALNSYAGAAWYDDPSIERDYFSLLDDATRSALAELRESYRRASSGATTTQDSAIDRVFTFQYWVEFQVNGKLYRTYISLVEGASSTLVKDGKQWKDTDGNKELTVPFDSSSGWSILNDIVLPSYADFVQKYCQ